MVTSVPPDIATRVVVIVIAPRRPDRQTQIPLVPRSAHWGPIEEIPPRTHRRAPMSCRARDDRNRYMKNTFERSHLARIEREDFAFHSLRWSPRCDRSRFQESLIMLCGDAQMTLETESVLFFAPPFTMMRSFRTPRDTFRHRYGRLALTTAQKAHLIGPRGQPLAASAGHGNARLQY